MNVRVGINGFGRIGRNYLRCVGERAEQGTGTPSRSWRSTTSPRRRHWPIC